MIMSKGKFRVVPVLILTLAGFGITMSYDAYQGNLKQVAIELDTQGMDEFEVCYYALKKFGAEMMKDMGCLKPRQ